MTETLKLPVLPLTDSVLLPGMVVPVRLDEPEIQAAVDAARPASTARSSSFPASTAVRGRRHRRRPRAGRPAAQRREGRGRARRGPGPDRLRRDRARRGPVGGGRPGRPTRRRPGGCSSSPRSTRRWSSSILQQRGAWQVIDSVRADHRPRRSWPTSPAGRPTSTIEQKAQLLAETDVQTRLELLVGWTKEHVAEQEVTEKIGKDVREGMEKTAARVPAAPAARRDPQGAGRGRAGGLRRLPRPRRGRRPARARAARPRSREVGKLERGSDQNPEAGWIRTWLDTVLDIPWNDAHRRQRRPGRRPRGARRRPRGPGRRQGAADRVPGRPRPARPPRPGEGRRPRLRRGDGAGRPARRRQDVARRVRRAGAGPQVRPGRPRRRPRRGRDPRAPAHLRRRAARPDRPRDPRGRLDEPGRAARRDRQGRLATTAATRPRPCSRCSTRRRTTRSATTTSRSTSTCPTCCSSPPPTSSRPSPARWPTGWSVVTLDGYTEAEKVAIARDHLLPRQIERAGLEPSRRRVLRRGARHDRRRVHPRGGRAAAGAGPGEGPAQGRRSRWRLGHAEAPVHVDADTLVKLPGPAEVHAGVGGAHGRAGRGHRARGHRRRRRRALHRGHRDGRRPGPDPDRPAGRRHEGVGARSRCPTCGRNGRWPGRPGVARSCTCTCPAGAVPKDGPSAGITMTTALASLASGVRCGRRSA